jgi:hypothetical protein
MDVGQTLAAYMRDEVADHWEVTMEGISQMGSKPTAREWVRKVRGTAVQWGINHLPKANVVA